MSTPESSGSGATAPLICHACGVENTPGAKFCHECGARLVQPAPPPPAVVRCPACGAENEAGSHYCEQCGAALGAAAVAPAVAVAPVCPACGAENAPNAKFCRSCGSRLATTPPAPAAAPVVPPAAPAAAPAAPPAGARVQPFAPRPARPPAQAPAPPRPAAARPGGVRPGAALAVVLVLAAAVAGAFVVLRSRDGGGTGSDEAYVRAVCIATKKFGEETERYFSDPELVQDSEKLSKAIAGPLRTYVNRMAAARPPADARAYHDALLKQLRALLAAAERGDFLQALRDFGDTPEPPPEVEARLSAVAESMEECEDINPFD